MPRKKTDLKSVREILSGPAVIVPREHQSAPKEHWADKEIKKAAEEIDKGQFVPQVDENDFLAIGLTRGLNIQSPAMIDGAEKMRRIDETADSMTLAQHPRVQDALRRLEQEKREARHSQEMAEKAQMLHEMNARAAEPNQWDGQGRWIGDDNENMRIVNILQPTDFMKKLAAVIGETRVFLNRFAVLKRVALLVPNTEANRAKLWTPGVMGFSESTDKMLQVGTLQYPCSPEWMVMRFDEYGVPTRPKYLGWRTALLSMITLKVITEKEAHRAFPLQRNAASAWYEEQLFELRNREGVLAS